MKILITNDDGIQAPGIRSLVNALKPLGDITVVAPATQQTAKGNAMTYDRELICERYDFDEEVKAYKVYGTPRDCIYAALDVFMDEKPDLVVSGINEGANLSNCCVSSGTIGAATGAYAEGLVAIATSLDFGSEYPYDRFAPYLRDIAAWFVKQPFCHDFILSVNLPNPKDGIVKGVTVGDYGGRQIFLSKYEVEEESDGKITLLMKGSGVSMEDVVEDLDHDMYALAQGYIVLTPLDDDVVKKDSLESLKSYITHI